MLPDTTYLEMPQGLAQQLLFFPPKNSPFLGLSSSPPFSPTLGLALDKGQVGLWVYSSQCPWLSAEDSRS